VPILSEPTSLYRTKGLRLAYVGRWITPVDGGTLFRSYLRHDLISFYRSCVERGKRVGFTNPDFDSSGSVIYRYHLTYLLTYLLTWLRNMEQHTKQFSL